MGKTSERGMPEYQVRLTQWELGALVAQIEKVKHGLNEDEDRVLMKSLYRKLKELREPALIPGGD